MRARLSADLPKTVFGSFVCLLVGVVHAHIGDHPYPLTATSNHGYANIVAVNCSNREVKMKPADPLGSSMFAYYHACTQIKDYCGLSASYPNPGFQVSGGLAKHCTIHNNNPGVGFTFTKFRIWDVCQFAGPNCEGPLVVTDDKPDAVAEPEDLNDIPQRCEDGSSPQMSAIVGNPIDVGSQNKYQIEEIYTGVGNFPLEFYWRYNSRTTKWRHTYERSIDLHLFPDEVILERHDGQHVRFQPDIAGDWIASGFSEDTLLQTASGWTFILSNGLVETYDGAGKLLSITNRSGLSHTLTYDTIGNLSSVSHTSGRSLAFSFYAQPWYLEHKIASITDPEGNVYRFGQGYWWDLESITYPDATPLDDTDNPVKTFQYRGISYQMAAMTGITDELGNVYATYSYDWDMNPLTTELAGGVNRYSVVYNLDGTADVTNPLGKVTKYSFQTVNGMKRLTQVDGQASANCPATTANTSYDANGNPDASTDRNGNVTNYTYDADGRQTARTQAVGTPLQRTISTVWDSSHRVPAQVVRDGRTEVFTYNTAGQVLTRTLTDTTSHTVPYSTNGQTQTWTYTYNSNGLLQTIDGPRTDAADVTTFMYDAAFDLHTVTNALGHVTTVLDRDARGYPTRLEDENGLETRLAYSPRGQLVSRTVKSAQGDAVTSFAYDAAKQLERVTLPDGSFIEFEYDDAHRLVAIQNAVGDRIEYTLDNMGSVTAENIKDSGLVTRKALTRTFDEAARLIEVLGSNGQDQDITYDLNGNLKTISNALGHTTTQFFDALDRLEKSTDPANNDTLYSYDPRDNVTQVTDPRGVITTYVYDGFDRVIQESSPDAGSTTYVYDAAGNLTQSTDARGVVTQYSYDALNRLTAVTYPASAGENIAYSYDIGANSTGRLYQISDESGSTAYSYDDRGNVVSEVRVIGGLSYTTSYGYSLSNVLSSMTYPSGRVVTFGRDSTQRISGITTLPLGGATSPVLSNVTYAPFGRATGWTYGNAIVQSSTYDLDYRLSSLASGSILNLSYGYSNVDSITSISDVLAPSNSQTLAYDSMQLLTDATGAYGDVDYTYDAVGNRLSRTVIDGTSTVNETYTVASSSNRLLSVSRNDNGVLSTRTLGYSAVGAVDVDTRHDGSVRSLVYNNRNRLTSVSDGSGTLGSYIHNALGQRVTKGDSSGITHYHYDLGGRLIAETDSLGTTIREYIFDEAGLRAIGQPGGSLDFVHSDHLGTPKVTTDGAGLITWSGSHMPFGEVSQTGVSQPIRFPGQFADSETGYSYNYYRSYDPTIGRYLKSDPIGLFAGLNTYGYVNANPLRYSDPTGLDQFVVLYEGQNGNPFGHVGIGLRPDRTYGKGPDEGEGIGFPNAVPGHIGVDRGTPIAILQFRTTAEQDHQLVRHIGLGIRDQQQYLLLEDSCVDFVREGLGSSGIDLPIGIDLINTPRGFFDALARDGEGVVLDPLRVIPD